MTNVYTYIAVDQFDEHVSATGLESPQVSWQKNYDFASFGHDVEDIGKIRRRMWTYTNQGRNFNQVSYALLL